MSKRRFGLWLLILMMGLLCARSPAAQAGARAGLAVCAGVLLPALFPLSVLSCLLLRCGGAAALSGALARPMQRFLHLPGAAALPLLSGLLGGYPLGAQSLAALYRRGALSRAEATAASACCNNPGPAFLIGAVGAGVFGDARLGLLLWLVELSAALLTALLLAPARPPRPRQAQKAPQPGGLLAQLPAASFDALQSMLRVCGTVVFFSALRAALTPERLCLPLWAEALLNGLLELTGGVLHLSSLPRLPGFVLAAFLCGWGGLCVHMQAADALLQVDLPLRRYLAGKACQALLAAALACIWLASLRLIAPAAGLI